MHAQLAVQFGRRYEFHLGTVAENDMVRRGELGKLLTAALRDLLLTGCDQQHSINAWDGESHG